MTKEIEIFIERPLYNGKCIDAESGKMLEGVIAVTIDCAGHPVTAEVISNINPERKKVYRVKRIVAKV